MGGRQQHLGNIQSQLPFHWRDGIGSSAGEKVKTHGLLSMFFCIPVHPNLDSFQPSSISGDRAPG